MAYAYRFMNKSDTRFFNADRESFDHLEEMFASLLNRSLDSIFKQGMHHEYESNEEYLRNPKGKMNITKTVTSPYESQQKIYCEFDQFTLNNPFNQITKATIKSLLKSKYVPIGLKTKLRHKAILLHEVNEIDLHKVNWSTINYNRNNRNYRFVLYVCQLLANQEIFSDSLHKGSLHSFLDSQEGHQLYEKFILAYYQTEYPESHAQPRLIQWNTDEENMLLPVMRTDVFLDFSDRAMIIEAKFYKNPLAKSIYNENERLRSQHLYQIYSYLDNYSAKMKAKSASGVLLYAVTSDREVLDEELLLSEHQVRVRSISLHRDFSIIRNELDSLVNA